MEIVIIFICSILCFGFFYCFRKYCIKSHRIQQQNLLDDFDELEQGIDLESHNKPIENTELTHVNYVSQSTDECSICLETFENKEIVQFKCFHKYHTECINDWINRRNNNINCPECGI